MKRRSICNKQELEGKIDTKVERNDLKKEGRSFLEDGFKHTQFQLPPRRKIKFARCLQIFKLGNLAQVAHARACPRRLATMARGGKLPPKCV